MDLSQKIVQFNEEIQTELIFTSKYQKVGKDILIVTHNNLSYLKQCIESIRLSTEDYCIYLWDNGSDQNVQDWISEQQDLRSFRSEENLGFIVPNNILASHGISPYIILINDDCVVRSGWDRAMIGFMQQTGVSQVGYCGGWCNEEGKGSCFGWGSKIDYVCGYCFSIPREIYKTHGLFDDKNLSFAYCEDSDFSFRLRDAGEKIHALHLDYVHHFENITIKKNVDEELKAKIVANHNYFKTKWSEMIGVSHESQRT